MWLTFISGSLILTYPEVIPGIVYVYQQAFGGEPWNEGYLCPVCETAVALADGPKECPECAKLGRSVIMVEYWPESKVVSDYYREMMRPGSLCVIARDNKETIGFAWGYKVSVTPELDKHLEAPELHTLIDGDFFYLDECAVVPQHQGKGFGALLMERVRGTSRRILLRTMDGSRMCRLVTRMGGKIVQHISRGRVIMVLESK